MSTPQENAALRRQLASFLTALKSDDRAKITPFFAENADFRSARGIVRGREEIAAAADQSLRLRQTADIVAIKWLSNEIALVDGVFEADKDRGWFTEVWQKSKTDRNYLIRTSRIRLGPAAPSFEGLNRVAPHTVADELQPSVQNREEKELRKKFKEFRRAFNKADSKGVVKLFAPGCDAIVAFSFLRGRAQILTGRSAIEGKADRMNGNVRVSNPVSTRLARDRLAKSPGATFAAGETKVIRFLSSRVAVVDGTAKITGIPAAHGFAPREMEGVYTNVWRKSGSAWQIEGTRPWF